jgi:hypothetical protein
VYAPRIFHHFSSAFILDFAHNVVLEFENSLLSIDPSIGALPYWNWNDTNAMSIFTPAKYGSIPGTGPNQELVDGNDTDG